MKDVNKAFGMAVRRRRQELGLSQEELAFRAALHRTYVSLIERGLRGATVETIVKLAEALNTTASHMLEHVAHGAGSPSEPDRSKELGTSRLSSRHHT